MTRGIDPVAHMAALRKCCVKAVSADKNALSYNRNSETEKSKNRNGAFQVTTMLTY